MAFNHSHWDLWCIVRMAPNSSLPTILAKVRHVQNIHPISLTLDLKNAWRDLPDGMLVNMIQGEALNVLCCLACPHELLSSSWGGHVPCSHGSQNETCEIHIKLTCSLEPSLPELRKSTSQSSWERERGRAGR